jgi:hypothetical protein
LRPYTVIHLSRGDFFESTRLPYAGQRHGRETAGFKQLNAVT